MESILVYLVPLNLQAKYPIKTFDINSDELWLYERDPNAPSNYSEPCGKQWQHSIRGWEYWRKQMFWISQMSTLIWNIWVPGGSGCDFENAIFNLVLIICIHWSSVDLDLCRHIISLSQNDLMGVSCRCPKFDQPIYQGLFNICLTTFYFIIWLGLIPLIS